MRIREHLHGLLMLSPDDQTWIAWCPQLDVFTQGDHVDHAAAMLEEACTMVIEEAVSNISSFDGDIVSKNVVHPLRLGEQAKEDESWHTYQKALEFQRGESRGYDDWYPLSVLSDNRDEVLLLDGDLNITTRSGIVKVSVSFNDYAYVESERFSVEYTLANPRKSTFAIRKSTRPEDRQKLIDEGAAIVARNAIGEVKVTKRDPLS